MPTVTIRIEGIEEFRRRLNGMNGIIATAIDAEVKQASDQLRRAMGLPDQPTVIEGEYRVNEAAKQLLEPSKPL